MLPLIAAEIYEQRLDLQSAFPGAHTAGAPLGYWRWFCHHAGREYDIPELVNCFRPTLLSKELCHFATQVSALVGSLKFLGSDRMAAVEMLRQADRADLADILVEARMEWLILTEVSGALEITAVGPT